MSKKSRKLILVRTDLLGEATKITAKEGRTLFSFTNEIFEQAIKAYKMSVTLSEALEFYKMINIGKSAGYIVLPYDVFKFMTEELYGKRQKELLKVWWSSGFWSGNYLKVKFDDDIFKALKQFFKTLMWGFEDFSIKFENDKIDVKCFSSNLTSECTEMLVKYLEGIFESLGFATKKNVCLKGIIMMELVRKNVATEDKFKKNQKPVEVEG